MKPLKTKISITLDDPVLDQIKELADLEDRSLSSYINLVLKAHLEALDREKPGKTTLQNPGSPLDSPGFLY